MPKNRAFQIDPRRPGLGGSASVQVTAPPTLRHPHPRIGVLVVAYNAEDTLAATLSRLPDDFLRTVDHILVSDDASADNTFEVGLRFRNGSTVPMTVVRHERNLGYGGNQKQGYAWAMEQGLDVVVLLHGDGQYAPEHIEQLVQPLVDGRADAVFGSRMMTPGGARAGGMPLYKYLGNKILTRAQNRLAGANLSEWHSGYRAYRVDALSELDLNTYSDGFNFDTEIILGLLAAEKTILEVPIPTYYGDEICYVNGLQYARDVMVDVLRYRLGRIGFGQPGPDSGPDSAYELKPSPHSSHGVLLAWLRSIPAGQVCDIGCSDGQFAALAGAIGHEVTGVDLVKHAGVAERVDRFVEADLNQGLPAAVGTGFRAVVAGDVLEHVIDPGRLLAELVECLDEGGELLVSVPNFAHWYPRIRVLLGRFDYDQRGLLDQGHVRFFTRRSFERLVRRSGLVITAARTVGSPFEALDRGGPGAGGLGPALRLVAAVDRAAARIWPTMFGYQFLYRLERR